MFLDLMYLFLKCVCMLYIFIIGSVRNLNIYNQRWGGAVATIEEEEGNEVWGVLWQVKSTRSGDGLI